ncbi:MAG: rhodanese-like domain-containing protein [Woeseiaceae bacterium]
MKNIFFALLALFATFSSTSLLAADKGFPGRAEYPEIPLYQKADLLRDFNKVVIVDARSPLEFKTIHIKGAVNIPIASRKFPEMAKALRKKTKKPIVFYCNGRTCYKSYKAVKAALKAGLKNVYSYDAGMFEWAKTYPKYAVLLGQNPMNPKNIIPKSQLKRHFLSISQFNETARTLPRNTRMVLDVRDMHQRAGIGLFIGIEKWVSMNDEKKLFRYLDKAKAENKTLYIYDETGKQVRWLQYTLEQRNIKNYFFMTKGARGFHKKFIM